MDYLRLFITIIMGVIAMLAVFFAILIIYVTIREIIDRRQHDVHTLSGNK